MSKLPSPAVPAVANGEPPEPPFELLVFAFPPALLLEEDDVVLPVLLEDIPACDCDAPCGLGSFSSATPPQATSPLIDVASTHEEGFQD